MAKQKSNKKTLRIVLLSLLLVFILAVGSLLTFILLGKDQTMRLELDGVSLNTLEDGIYAGSYEGFRWSTAVEVTVKGHRIIEIQETKSQVFATKDTISTLTGEVLFSQTTKVDAVSGATIDSKAFLKAVENALKSPPVG